MVHYTDKKNVELFARHGVYTYTEIKSRQDINMEEYTKVVHIEALTMIDMLGKLIVPSCVAYFQDDGRGRCGKEEHRYRSTCGSRSGQLLSRKDR